MRIVMLERIGHGWHVVDTRCLILDLFQVGNVSDLPAPQPLDLRGRGTANRPMVKMQLHRRQVTGVVIVLVPQTRRYGVAHNDADRVDGRSAELLVDGVSCFDEPFCGRERLLERSADGELQICLNIAGNVRFLVQD